MFNKRAMHFPLIFACAFTLLVACNNSGEKKEMTQAEKISRGEFLVNFGGCEDCHSPKVMTPQGPMPDSMRRLSGSPENLVLPEVDPALIQPGK